MAIEKELLDRLFADFKYTKPEDLIGENGLLKQLTKGLVERALQAEMTDHLGHEKHGAIATKGGNARNGKSAKTIKGEFGKLPIEVPRDRDATFEPTIIPKGQTRFAGFDGKIISLYARGMTTREIQGHLEEIYGVEVSPSLISSVTDAIADEVKIWQNRPLDPLYPIVYMDAVRVKVRDNGHVSNKAVYLALGVTMDGIKEVLGMWVAENEGAKFWLQVVTELKTVALKTSSSPAWMASRASPKPSRRFFPAPRSSSASSTWCATPSNTFRGSSARRWLPTSRPFTRRRPSSRPK